MGGGFGRKDTSGVVTSAHAYEVAIDKRWPHFKDDASKSVTAKV